jgi:hypothetical protein
MKGIGKVDTQTVLILGAAGLVIYMMMNRAPTLPPSYQYNPGLSAQQLLLQQQNAQGNTTAGIISASGSALGNLLTGISNLF